VPSIAALSTYRFQGKLERAIREEWIRPLLEHLGYGIDTLNDVLYEERLTLRNNRRKIGSEIRMVDYIPTVLGHGLWIIEAKAPEARDPWDDVLSQAWLYATHPEVDVPLMAIADGSRFAVYEVNRIDWDVALLDLTIDQLVERFDKLVHVLGAAHVAETIRTRQLRHLEQAMRAELDPVRLDETVAAVREIANRTRAVVLKNRGRVLLDQFERVAQGTDETIRSVGLWGIAQIHNQPIANNLSDVARAVSHVRSLPEHLRIKELDQFVAATQLPAPPGGEPGPPRMFWMARIVGLAIYLELRHDPGCGHHAHELATRAIRDHILNFPEDPVARAAHRLECVLPPFVLRVILASQDVDLPAIARKIADRLDDEARLRAGAEPDQILLRTVSLRCRQIFAQSEWTESALNEAAEQLETITPRIEFERDPGRGQAHDLYMDFYLSVDQLLLATLGLLTAKHLDLFDEAVLARLGELEAPITHSRIRGAARALLESVRVSPTPTS
jgi:hypothetical protein